MTAILSLISNFPAVLAAIATALMTIWGYGKVQRRKGRKEGAERVSHRAEVAAEKRKEQRDEIDADNDVSAARDRLREDWTD